MYCFTCSRDSIRRTIEKYVEAEVRHKQSTTEWFKNIPPSIYATYSTAHREHLFPRVFFLNLETSGVDSDAVMRFSICGSTGERFGHSLGGMTRRLLWVRVLNDDSSASRNRWHPISMDPGSRLLKSIGIYRDDGSNIQPLITFLSICVNARCILLIQTTVFITSNGLGEEERRTHEGRRGSKGG